MRSIYNARRKAREVLRTREDRQEKYLEREKKSKTSLHTYIQRMVKLFKDETHGIHERGHVGVALLGRPQGVLEGFKVCHPVPHERRVCRGVN
jgi:hypothetical protein